MRPVAFEMAPRALGLVVGAAPEAPGKMVRLRQERLASTFPWRTRKRVKTIHRQRCTIPRDGIVFGAVGILGVSIGTGIAGFVHMIPPVFLRWYSQAPDPCTHQRPALVRRCL
jgi:hypothetical protein